MKYDIKEGNKFDEYMIELDIQKEMELI